MTIDINDIKSILLFRAWWSERFLVCSSHNDIMLSLNTLKGAYESHGPLLMPLFILEFDIINPTFVLDKRAARTFCVFISVSQKKENYTLEQHVIVNDNRLVMFV